MAVKLCEHCGERCCIKAPSVSLKMSTHIRHPLFCATPRAGKITFEYCLTTWLQVFCVYNYNCRTLLQFLVIDSDPVLTCVSGLSITNAYSVRVFLSELHVVTKDSCLYDDSRTACLSHLVHLPSFSFPLDISPFIFLLTA